MKLIFTLLVISSLVLIPSYASIASAHHNQGEIQKVENLVTKLNTAHDFDSKEIYKAQLMSILQVHAGITSTTLCGDRINELWGTDYSAKSLNEKCLNQYISFVDVYCISSDDYHNYYICENIKKGPIVLLQKMDTIVTDKSTWGDDGIDNNDNNSVDEPYEMGLTGWGCDASLRQIEISVDRKTYNLHYSYHESFSSLKKNYCILKFEPDGLSFAIPHELRYGVFDVKHLEMILSAFKNAKNLESYSTNVYANENFGGDEVYHSDYDPSDRVKQESRIDLSEQVSVVVEKKPTKKYVPSWKSYKTLDAESSSIPTFSSSINISDWYENLGGNNFSEPNYEFPSDISPSSIPTYMPPTVKFGPELRNYWIPPSFDPGYGTVFPPNWNCMGGLWTDC